MGDRPYDIVTSLTRCDLKITQNRCLPRVHLIGTASINKRDFRHLLIHALKIRLEGIYPGRISVVLGVPAIGKEIYINIIKEIRGSK